MSPVVRRRRRRSGWRQLTRSLRRTSRRTRILAAGGAAALLVVAWLAWTLWSVTDDLGETERQAALMRAAMVRGDAEGAARALDRYLAAAEGAEDSTSGVAWSAMELLPVLGDDLEGIELVAEVLAGIGRDALPPVVDAAEQVTADAFQPQDHRFPLDRIQAMEEPALASETALEAASLRLAPIDSTSFVGPLQQRFDDLRLLVDDARSTLGSAYRAARLMPLMMGADRPRNYLLVLQNNAELRSGGGLPGALSLVQMKDGRVDIVEQVDMADLGGRDAVVALTPEEREIFGPILSTKAVDATLTPDLPRAADIVRARWEKRVGGRLDGVVFVDPVAVSYLLQGTGPVTVPGFPPVDAATVVAAVENQIYLATEDRQVHSDYQEAVSEAVFDTFADGTGDTPTAIRGLVTAVTEGRVRMHSFNPEEQAEIAGTEIAGELSDATDPEPDVGIYLNDAGPTKMQYYLEYDASIFARSCTGDRQELGGFLDLHSNTPAQPESLPGAITGSTFPGVRVAPGDQLLVIYLTSPVGGEISELRVDGQSVEPDPLPFAGRSLVRIGLGFSPQERHRIEFVARSGPEQTADPRLRVTPGAAPGGASDIAPSACRVR